MFKVGDQLRHKDYNIKYYEVKIVKHISGELYMLSFKQSRFSFPVLVYWVKGQIEESLEKTFVTELIDLFDQRENAS